ncbi:uncharacterized protein A1O9_08034 [Exophiala aquamarina CBS 119918]|uniref:Glutathione S-transferase n=1 Tax=Exophiala aquamarina CBS 119918 TaxID=1182545 RepID=A0A072PB01_9EURO|nr:uncharacterized protein A1O9_08034 [Exophiala aquamarina CBS 119918]KEF56453.1 hypothetical protein A1O9_08034 [Exophiala aquamarina CBS 119918]
MATTTAATAPPPGPPFTIHHLHIGQSERIIWLAEELGLSYTLQLHTRHPIFSPPSLTALTPQGSAPVLASTTPSGTPFVISETNAITEYLLSPLYNPSGHLTVRPGAENYHAYVFWLHFANGTLQPALGRKLTAQGLDPEGLNPRSKATDAGVAKALRHLDARLRETRAWLAGDVFTAADVMTVWCVTTMRQFSPVDLSPYEGVLHWLARVAQREAYQRAMAKGDPELDWRRAMTAEGPGLFPPLLALREKGKSQSDGSKGGHGTPKA